MPSAEYLREWRKKNPTKSREHHLRYKAKLGDEEFKRRQREYQSERNKEQRTQAILKLGGFCVECGHCDIRALEIDHIHGNGTQERQTVKTRQLYVQILRGERDDLQLLCGNCHNIKTWHSV